MSSVLEKGTISHNAILAIADRMFKRWMAPAYYNVAFQYLGQFIQTMSDADKFEFMLAIELEVIKWRKAVQRV